MATNGFEDCGLELLVLGGPGWTKQVAMYQAERCFWRQVQLLQQIAMHGLSDRFERHEIAHQRSAHESHDFVCPLRVVLVMRYKAHDLAFHQTSLVSFVDELVVTCQGVHVCFEILLGIQVPDDCPAALFLDCNNKTCSSALRATTFVLEIYRAELFVVQRRNNDLRLAEEWQPERFADLLGPWLAGLGVCANSVFHGFSSHETRFPVPIERRPRRFELRDVQKYV